MGILLHKFHSFQNHSSGGISLKRVNILGRNLDNTWSDCLKDGHQRVSLGMGCISRYMSEQGGVAPSLSADQFIV
ncbi:hypothetical protein FRX31_012472 [Thalictrum thalictroides]|uniref:Uncharacterized protein n=1 Tax=Thalictrum thalictroides TaxID=46969 RepID=A0A7J6WKM7_THATH|nr:hypothetical protein FRX31_012472 [Thalictrum thalictroides]